MNTFLGANVSREEVVIKAGDRCYGGLLSSFHMGGYPKVLAAIGDHELGKYKLLMTVENKCLMDLISDSSLQVIMLGMPPV